MSLRSGYLSRFQKGRVEMSEARLRALTHSFSDLLASSLINVEMSEARLRALTPASY